jgi:hypothetical protein
MALTYSETAALMNDVQFKDRSKIACLHYAVYIEGEADTVPAHNTRMNWARQTFSSPENSVTTIMPILVMDTKVQDAGVDAEGHSLITDPDLQSATEASVNLMF